MAKIKLDMESFSNEADFEDAVKQASNALPDGQSATPATQIRDANGKLVSVTVGLPSNTTAQQRTDARNAIVNSNPGVAKAVALPIEMSEDFDSLTPGNPLPSQLSTDGEILTITEHLSTWTNLKAASSTEAQGGIGSAFEVANDAGTNGVHNFISVRGDLTYDVSNTPDINQISSYVCEFDVKASSTGDTGDIEHFKTTALMGDSGSAGTVRVRANGSGNWELSVHGQTPIDTGVSQYDYLHVKVTMSGDGVLSATAGSASDSIDFGFPKIAKNLTLAMTSQDRFSTVPAQGAKKAQSTIMDNYSLSITGV